MDSVIPMNTVGAIIARRSQLQKIECHWKTRESLLKSLPKGLHQKLPTMKMHMVRESSRKSLSFS